MRLTRILFWPLFAGLLMGGTAAASPGDPYVVYTANSFVTGAVVLRADPATGSLLEISRNGPQGSLFQRPYDLAVEPDGSLVVADLGEPCTAPTEPCAADGRIVRVDPVTGAQGLVASGVQLVDPAGIAVAPNGDLWVADNLEPDDSGRVVRVDPRTGAQTTVSEGGRLDLPFGIAVDRDGSLVVANRTLPGQLPPDCQPGGKVVRVDPVTGFQHLVSEAGSIAWPLGLALDADRGIVVANECATPGGLVRVDPLGGSQRVLTGNGQDDVLVTPERVAFDPGGAPLVSDFALGADGEGGIARVDPATGAQSLLAGGDLFNHPLGIAAVANRPPAASLAAQPPLVAAGDTVRLDASGSSDPEGQRLLYEWDLDGDGSFEAGSGTSAVAERSFTQHGPATVRTRVNDPHGGRAVAETIVNVDGSIPLITGLRASARVVGVRRGERRRGESRRGRREESRRGGNDDSERGRGGESRRGRPGPRPRHSETAKRPPRATTISFELSEPAGVSLAIERARAGRRSAGGPCRVRARRGRRCFLWRQARLVETPGAAGPNEVRLAARGLRPGRHRVQLSAVDAVGNRSARRSLPLRVVRLRRR
jgi:DNA-binding beta-propeller fold protein YncE